jgi:hypothetical protein
MFCVYIKFPSLQSDETGPNVCFAEEEWSRNIGRVIKPEITRSSGRKPYPSAHLSTKNSAWHVLGRNLGHFGENQASNHLKCGRANILIVSNQNDKDRNAVIFILFFSICRPEQRSLYSGWLRVGRSGVWILWGHSASYAISTGSFLGVKRPGRCVNHPLPSSAEVKERVELHTYPLLEVRGLL